VVDKVVAAAPNPTSLYIETMIKAFNSDPVFVNTFENTINSSSAPPRFDLSLSKSLQIKITLSGSSNSNLNPWHTDAIQTLN
jgi:hypothetical protein